MTTRWNDRTNMNTICWNVIYKIMEVYMVCTPNRDRSWHGSSYEERGHPVLFLVLVWKLKIPNREYEYIHQEPQTCLLNNLHEI